MREGSPAAARHTGDVTLVTCVDVGSTFTKGVLIDVQATDPDRLVVATAAHPTTIAADVMDGVDAVCRVLAAHAEGTSQAGLGSPAGNPSPGESLLVCSSAGGGLRIAVVGQELEVSAEAGRRVALSAGGRVVQVSSGELTAAEVRALRNAAPDLILLVGGTDGGNAAVLLHNADCLARARIKAPIVVAGNADAADEVSRVLADTGRRFELASNVVPRIGGISPTGARAAIRSAFLDHVIGGKGLSRGRGFADLVLGPTPDAVLRGVEVLAEVVGGDVLVIDIGGATTDVYSVITPQGEDATIRRDVVGQLWHARTVEADLGMRWSAEGIVEAASRERIPLSDKTIAYAVRAVADPSHLASSDEDWAAERELATAAATIAVRRHGRPAHPSEAPRPLADVTLVLGSGGVLRHSPSEISAAVLDAVSADHGGGWRVPAAPRKGVDTAYLLFAVGLLADRHSTAAHALAGRIATLTAPPEGLPGRRGVPRGLIT